jgi:8-oxo-dGTP pyrophosphatase MutT (NUDIX family)
VPGGKRHDGESDLDTLLREVEEELTVTLRPETVRHFGTFEAGAEGKPLLVRVACYTAAYDGTLSPSAEIEELAWMAYADRHRTPPVDQLVFDALLAAGRLRQDVGPARSALP